MAYLNLDLDFIEHRKTKRIVGLLGEGAEVYLLRLWSYCGRFHCEDGVFRDYTNSEIESIAGWKGEPGAMLQAMLRVGWMECVQQCGQQCVWQMHDWEEHQGHLAAFKVRGREMAKKRWGKAKSAGSDAARIATGNATCNAASNTVSNAPTNQPTNITHSHTLELKIEKEEPKPETHRGDPGPRQELPDPVPVAFAEHPDWKEVQAHCQVIGLPEWKARMWWDEMEAVGWMRKGQPIRAWRPLLNTVRTWWQSDGSPMHPPARGQAGAQGHTSQAAAPKTDWADHKKLDLIEAEIKKVKGRGTESALGTSYTQKDADRLKELIAKRTEIKNRLLA